MALKPRNKVSPNFNMSSLTDIIFLLLIFFMLTSTLVSPNALKLLLPSSNSQTLAKQTVSVSITKELKYYLDKESVTLGELKESLKEKFNEIDDATIVLNADKSVPVDNLVQVMNVANDLGLKMILATKQISK